MNAETPLVCPACEGSGCDKCKGSGLTPEGLERVERDGLMGSLLIPHEGAFNPLDKVEWLSRGLMVRHQAREQRTRGPMLASLAHLFFPPGKGPDGATEMLYMGAFSSDEEKNGYMNKLRIISIGWGAVGAILVNEAWVVNLEMEEQLNCRVSEHPRRTEALTALFDHRDFGCEHWSAALEGDDVGEWELQGRKVEGSMTGLIAPEGLPAGMREVAQGLLGHYRTKPHGGDREEE